MEFDLRLWDFISTLDFKKIKTLEDCKSCIFIENVENDTASCFQLHCTNTQGFISFSLYDEQNQNIKLLSIAVIKLDNIHDVRLYDSLRNNI